MATYIYIWIYIDTYCSYGIRTTYHCQNYFQFSDLLASWRPCIVLTSLRIPNIFRGRSQYKLSFPAIWLHIDAFFRWQKNYLSLSVLYSVQRLVCFMEAIRTFNIVEYSFVGRNQYKVSFPIIWLHIDTYSSNSIRTIYRCQYYFQFSDLLDSWPKVERLIVSLSEALCSEQCWCGVYLWS